MQIKTADGIENVGSAGVAGAGLGLGIAGTALGLLQNGGLNGILGGGNQNQILPITELSKEKAERYADNIGIATFKEAQTMSDKTNERLLALEKFVYEIDKKVAVERQQTVDNFAFLNNEIRNTKNEVMCYVNANFVSGELVMPLSKICPPAQPAATTT